METFIKVYIKSEEDLPKVTYNYFAHRRSDSKYIIMPWIEDDAEYGTKVWLRTCDWYLKPVEIPEITDDGNLLFNEMGEFSVKTFTGATAKGHLRKLKEEADEAIEDPTDIKEYADCLMALFGAAYKAGFTYDALIQAGKEKLEINKSRKWVKLENEIYQHVIENGTEKNNVKE